LTVIDKKMDNTIDTGSIEFLFDGAVAKTVKFDGQYEGQRTRESGYILG